jgi:hypothetical protein
LNEPRGFEVVRKLCDDGVHYYNEPPYTEEEEDMIYRGMDIDGPAAILHAPNRTAKEIAMWTTREYWKDTHHWVVLMRDGDVVAEMTLDQWAELPPTAALVADARSEAREALRQEVLGLPAD